MRIASDANVGELRHGNGSLSYRRAFYFENRECESFTRGRGNPLVSSANSVHIDVRKRPVFVFDSS